MDKEIIDFYANQKTPISKLIELRRGTTTPEQIEATAEEVYHKFKNKELDVKPFMLGKIVLATANMTDTKEFLERQEKLYNYSKMITDADKVRVKALKAKDKAEKKLEKHKKVFKKGAIKLAENIKMLTTRNELLKKTQASLIEEFNEEILKERRFASKSDAEKLQEIERIKNETAGEIAKVKEESKRESARLSKIHGRQQNMIQSLETLRKQHKATISGLHTDIATLKTINRDNSASLMSKIAEIDRLKNGQQLLNLLRKNEKEGLKNWIYALIGLNILTIEFIILRMF